MVKRLLHLKERHMKEAYSSFWSLAAEADYPAHPRAPFSLQKESVFNYWRLRFKNRYLSIKRILEKKPSLFDGFLHAGLQAFAQGSGVSFAA
jgi:hypothetical protein